MNMDTGSPVRRLQIISLIESITFLALICIAVPLKHLYGMPKPVSYLGPVHGVAFLAYFWALVAAVSEGGWTRNEIARTAIAAVIPFGGFINGGLLAQKAAGKTGTGAAA